MSDASDTFRLGLDAADRPLRATDRGGELAAIATPDGGYLPVTTLHESGVPNYPGDGIGEPDADDVPMVIAPIAASLLVPTDEVTEVDTPDGPWYVVLEVHPDRIVVDGAMWPGADTLAVDLPWRGTDRVLVRRIALPDASSDTAALAIDPALVTVAPSGRFGFYRPTNPQAWESEPTVQVAQVIARRAGMEFHPTPARYYARTIFGLEPGAALAIDSGQGWLLPPSDVDALRRFAAKAL